MGRATADGHEMWRKAGGLMQVLNHPDIHLDELFDFLGQIPADDRLDWTAMESADWWRRTHVIGEMRIRTTSERHIELTSTRPVYGAVLETLGPDGSRRRFEAELEPGSPPKSIWDQGSWSVAASDPRQGKHPIRSGRGCPGTTGYAQHSRRRCASTSDLRGPIHGDSG